MILQSADIYSDGFAYFKSRDLLKIVYRRSLDDEIFFFEIMEDKLRIKIDNLAIGTIPILHYSTCLNRSDIEYIPKKFEVTGGIFGKFGQLIDSFGGVKSQSIEAWMPFMLENDQEAIEIMIPMRCFEKIEDMESSFLESLIFYVYEDRILLKYCNIGIAFEKKIVKKQQCQ